MDGLLVYFLKVIAVHGALYLLYKLAFQNSRRHSINRGFLLSALVLGFAIPFIELPLEISFIYIPDEHSFPVWIENAERVLAPTEFVPVQVNNHAFDFWTILPWSFLFVSALLGIRSITNLMQLRRLKAKSQLIDKKWYSLFKSSVSQPFSFLKSIFIPEFYFNKETFKLILAHECAHVKHRHSFDRLFIDLMICLNWFNPFLYLYRKSVIEIHEFQADAEVLDLHSDPIQYQETLYQQLQTMPYPGVVSHFNFSTIKKRLKMMNNKKKQPLWLYGLTVPTTIIVLLMFSGYKSSTPLSAVKNDFSNMLESNLQMIGTNPFSTDSYLPSILPLKKTDKVRLTASYGMHMHPILKVKKMHEGIDLSSPVGNEVIATATGIVAFAKEFGDRGLLITIDHNGIYETSYSHLSRIDVEEGQKVGMGEVIGLSGNTGLSTAPHLHYEVRKVNQGRVNPMDFIDNYEFIGKAMKSEKNARPNMFSEKSSKENFRVVIDPGHGGKDSGLEMPYGDLEKEITLIIAKKIVQNFADHSNIEIELTRTNDEYMPLGDRAKMSKGADLFLSLHIDEIKDKEGGLILPVYLSESEYTEQSSEFARIIADEFAKEGKNTEVGYTFDYLVLKESYCPAVLLKLALFSDPEEMASLRKEEGQAAIANEISDAIRLASSK